MRKIKKYIYPFVFFICFFATYIILAIVLNMFLPSGDYAGLAYACIALIIWVFFIIPFYCFKYSKIIYKGKHCFLFVFYNSLVVALSHTGPFLMSAIPNGDVGIIIRITLALLGWVAICTYVSLLTRLNSTVKQDDNNLNETEE